MRGVARYEGFNLLLALYSLGAINHLWQSLYASAIVDLAPQYF